MSKSVTIGIRFQSPLRFAMGGSVSDAAEIARQHGREDDTVLLHLTPEEFEAIKQSWGDPLVNPHTGLPEYSWLSKQFKSVKKAVIPKEIRKPFTWAGKHIVPDELQHVNDYVKKVTSPAFHWIRDKAVRPVAHWMGFGNAWDAAMGVGDESFGIDTMYDYYKHPNSGGKAAIDAGKAANAIASGYALQNLAGGGVGGGNTANAIGALGALANSSKGPEAPPVPTGSTGTSLNLELSPLNQFNDPGDMDYYTYGSRPEHQFFKPPGSGTLNQIPVGVAPPARAEPAGLSSVAEQLMTNPNKPDGMNVKTGFSTGNLVRGPGTGRSDDIPAQLSDGEYVMDAETVALLGDGSTDEGARKLDQLRERLRRHKGQQLSKGKFSANAKSPEEYIGE